MNLPVSFPPAKTMTPAMLRDLLLKVWNRYWNLILYGLIFTWLGSGACYWLIMALLLPVSSLSGNFPASEGRYSFLTHFLVIAMLLYLPPLLHPPLEMLNFLFVIILYLSVSHISRRSRFSYVALCLLDLRACNLSWMPAQLSACGLLSLIFCAGKLLLPSKEI